jgi:hypothetical protein
MLREHVLGAESFDRAFREYSQKWMFKHPQPADLFRTLASGAGERLDYFWAYRHLFTAQSGLLFS